MPQPRISLRPATAGLQNTWSLHWRSFRLYLSAFALLFLVSPELAVAQPSPAKKAEPTAAPAQPSSPPQEQTSLPPAGVVIKWKGTESSEVVQVADKVFAFRFENQSNMFVVTDDGVIATDPLNPRAAEQLVKTIQSVTDQPVRYIIYSHNHWNRVLGGRLFKRSGAQFISHEKCVPFFAAHPHPDLIPPDITFAEEYELRLGGLMLRLRYLGTNYGTCLAVIHLPAEKLLFVADLVVPKQVAFRFMPDFDLREWVRTLRELEKETQVMYLLPSRGRYVVAPAAAIREQREYLENLMESVNDLMSQGIRDPAELRRLVQLPDYQHWFMYHEWLPLNVERVWALYELGW